MTLPNDFQFNQGNLQDYVDCRRRFQLRYLLQVAWPALEAEPALENEQAMHHGAQFHRLIHRHLSNLPEERLTQTATREPLDRWWQNYLQHVPATLRGERHPEITLSASLHTFRLLAKYDLVSLQPEGKTIIYDWKTSRRRPRRSFLSERLQTRVYPYLLVRAGAFLNQGQPIQPQQVDMVYWFAEAPTEPERFVYSLDQYQKDEQYLSSLVAEIAGLNDDAFYLTPHEDRCRFCVYRSLCARGVKAGDLHQSEDDEREAAEGVDFDFEHIAEIAF